MTTLHRVQLTINTIEIIDLAPSCILMQNAYISMKLFPRKASELDAVHIKYQSMFFNSNIKHVKSHFISNLKTLCVNFHALSNCRTSLLKTFAFLIATIVGEKKKSFFLCKRTASNCLHTTWCTGKRYAIQIIDFAASSLLLQLPMQTRVRILGTCPQSCFEVLRKTSERKHVIYQTVINVFQWQPLSVTLSQVQKHRKV